MNRLRLYMLLFFLTLCVPLGMLVWHGYSGLAQEEKAQLTFFSEALFDQMENELAQLIEREEDRGVEAYGFLLGQGEASDTSSPLAKRNIEPYILGYLQNNPDGSFQTPEVGDMGNVPQDKTALMSELREANRVFNAKKFTMRKESAAKAAAAPAVKEREVSKEESGSSFYGRFLSRNKTESSKVYLGKKKQRVEEITAEQAYNIAQEEELVQSGGVAESRRQEDQVADLAASVQENRADLASSQPAVAEQVDDQVRFQVEVAPFQSVSINGGNVYIFRRIVIQDQIYRQGFLIRVEPFIQHLIATHFQTQPLAAFTSLQIERRDQPDSWAPVSAGAQLSHTDFQVQRIFPQPFNFLQVTLSAATIPASPARSSLNITLGVLVACIFFGLLAIYQSARAVVKLSERRAQFVSSVTHELKTPLTNIRMYIEMLQEGIAVSPEKEQEYLKILGSESTRLSGLINNVLDLAKLEKKQRHFHLQKGDLSDVLPEVERVMREKLKQEGYVLRIDDGGIPPFSYDRDVLIQILMNLIENSIKFGRKAHRKEVKIRVKRLVDTVIIEVSDRGPGIPKWAHKRVFDDFYRVDNDLTRTTGGTGIGLALVKKYMLALGGSVAAANNDEDGCTITLSLPVGQ